MNRPLDPDSTYTAERVEKPYGYDIIRTRTRFDGSSETEILSYSTERGEIFDYQYSENVVQTTKNQDKTVQTHTDPDGVVVTTTTYSLGFDK